jgi:hypothetical protein
MKMQQMQPVSSQQQPAAAASASASASASAQPGSAGSPALHNKRSSYCDHTTLSITKVMDRFTTSGNIIHVAKMDGIAP